MHLVILALNLSLGGIRPSYHPNIHFHYRIIPLKVKWQSKKTPSARKMPVPPSGSSRSLDKLEQLCDNYPRHGKVVHLVPFLFHALSAILCRKRESMSLTFRLPPLTAHTPKFSPKPGIFKHKRVGQPGKYSAHLHGIFASRYLHLSKFPIFVPPSFFLICLFNCLFNPVSQSISY